jgi:hypothetical protein
VSDWRAKLAQVGKGLAEQEAAQREREAAQLQAWRKRLQELDPVGQEVAQLADAYGVPCQWECNRFATYPGFRFRTVKPAREIAAEWRGATLYIRRDGQESPGQVADLTAELVKDQLMDLVLAVAEGQRKVPGKRR